MMLLTVPAYVLAFVQLGMFDYTGAISTYLREQQGLHKVCPISHIWGLSIVLILAFYPYVYLLSPATPLLVWGSRRWRWAHRI